MLNSSDGNVATSLSGRYENIRKGFECSFSGIVGRRSSVFRGEQYECEKICQYSSNGKKNFF